MPTKAPPASAPWQELEKQAYHACREWHIFGSLYENESFPNVVLPDERQTSAGCCASFFSS